MFPFQVDVSRLSYAAALDIIAPILPGGAIALGWLFGHEGVWTNLHDERILKIILAVFAVYVVGFVVLNLSAFELGIVALVVLIRKTKPHEPWKNSEWRKLASKFLGAELSPPVEETPAEPLRDEAPPTTNFEKLSKSMKQNFARAMAPLNLQLRWQKWYEILKAYFPMAENRRQSFGYFYFSVLNSIGWAGLISTYISSKHVAWLVWLACILTIAASHVCFTLNFSHQQDPDPSGDRLAAEILRAIKTRDSDVGSAHTDA